MPHKEVDIIRNILFRFQLIMRIDDEMRGLLCFEKKISRNRRSILKSMFIVTVHLLNEDFNNIKYVQKTTYVRRNHPCYSSERMKK